MLAMGVVGLALVVATPFAVGWLYNSSPGIRRTFEQRDLNLALLAACQQGNVAGVQRLLASGADANFAPTHQEPIQNGSTITSTVSDGEPCLRVAQRTNNLPLVAVLRHAGAHD
jgi:ankyrin repeat protein